MLLIKYKRRLHQKVIKNSSSIFSPLNLLSCLMQEIQNILHLGLYYTEHLKSKLESGCKRVFNIEILSTINARGRMHFTFTILLAVVATL